MHSLSILRKKNIYISIIKQKDYNFKVHIFFFFTKNNINFKITFSYESNKPLRKVRIC